MKRAAWIRACAAALLAVVVAGCGGERGASGPRPGSQTAAVSPATPGTFDTIEPQAARDYAAQGAYLLDVRFPYEWFDDLGHLRGAKQVPLPALESRLKELEAWKDKDVVVYCRVGARSHTASQILAAHGFTHVHNLRGGLEAYRDWEKQAGN